MSDLVLPVRVVAVDTIEDVQRRLWNEQWLYYNIVSLDGTKAFVSVLSVSSYYGYRFIIQVRDLNDNIDDDSKCVSVKVSV